MSRRFISICYKCKEKEFPDEQLGEYFGIFYHCELCYCIPPDLFLKDISEEEYLKLWAKNNSPNSNSPEIEEIK